MLITPSRLLGAVVPKNSLQLSYRAALLEKVISIRIAEVPGAPCLSQGTFSFKDRKHPGELIFVERLVIRAGKNEVRHLSSLFQDLAKLGRNLHRALAGSRQGLEMDVAAS